MISLSGPLSIWGISYYWQPRTEPNSLTHKIVPYCGVHRYNKIIYVVQ